MCDIILNKLFGANYEDDYTVDPSDGITFIEFISCDYINVNNGADYVAYYDPNWRLGGLQVFQILLLYSRKYNRNTIKLFLRANAFTFDLKFLQWLHKADITQFYKKMIANYVINTKCYRQKINYPMYLQLYKNRQDVFMYKYEVDFINHKLPDFYKYRIRGKITFLLCWNKGRHDSDNVLCSVPRDIAKIIYGFLP